MSIDPYKVLGVPKSAPQAEIKKAYRKLAKELHPDLHPDDAAKQERFKAVSAAYDLLSDPETRRRFDAGEIDASGQERAERQYYHHYAGQDAGRRYDPGPGFGGGVGDGDLGDIFSQFFGGRAGGPRQSGFHREVHARGQDLRYHLDVDFLDAVRGTKRRVTMPDGNTIEISIPPGLKDGQTLRLRGKGAPGYGEGAPGDALVTVSVRPHPVFGRTGDDIELELPITFDEAVLGGSVDVPTVWGPVSLTIPKGVSSGQRLRLGGKGIKPVKGKAGDQIVRLKIVLPKKIDKDMEDLAKRWRETAGFDPRTELGRST
ncbi:DnaJ domain-containing protein [Lutimaribacter pacificus]|uniref:DnaJ domain-containing protein n=1 Tax=Lutimaribacter pacificus TaxID=391948 RepID=A0A1H0NLZ5_9RHOB|nr:DnaJ C-terminal domain-containing protein [Lutimaribacter pacificus]SDO93661.1 DnaJ domain-containing protein [Lutimaribacter pacificus]SHK88073.1 DnaJ domain-containing protein [Lutimaribacter pacificus]